MNINKIMGVEKDSTWENVHKTEHGTTRRGKIIKVFIAIFIIIFLIMGIYLYSLLRSVELIEPEFLTENEGVITKQDFSNYLESHPAIQELPEDSSIVLNLGENEYLISEGEVFIEESGDIESDIDVSIPEEYLSMVAEVGLCQTIGEIAKEENFEIDTNLSTFELIKKYKGLLKYKDCLEV